MHKIRHFAPSQKLVRNFWWELSKPDQNASIPWRFQQLPSTQSEPRIQVGVYHKWTAITPPNPILMIHGLTGSHKTFSPLLRHSNYPWGVIAPDLRGHGGSEKAVPGRIGYIHDVNDYIRLTRQFQRNFFNVVAYDTGAFLALKVAQMFPELIGCITLIQGGRPGSPFSNELKDGYEGEMKKTLRGFKSKDDVIKSLGGDAPSVDVKDRLIYDYKEIMGRVIPRVQQEVVHQRLNDVESYTPTKDLLRQIQHPIVIIRSEYGFEKNTPNVILTDQDVADMKYSLNVKEVHTLKGATHGSILDTHAAQICKIQDDFLEKYDIQKIADNLMDSIRKKEEIQNAQKNMYGKGGVLEYLSAK